MEVLSCIPKIPNVFLAIVFCLFQNPHRYQRQIKQWSHFCRLSDTVYFFALECRATLVSGFLEDPEQSRFLLLQDSFYFCITRFEMGPDLKTLFKFSLTAIPWQP
jgi:hypothetical protein